MTGISTSILDVKTNVSFDTVGSTTDIPEWLILPANNTQIMTGLEGNWQIYLPREIQDRLQKSFY